MYKGKEIDWEDDPIKQMQDNMNELRRQNKEAYEAGELVGRVIEIPYADGYAYYQIIRENKRTLRVRVCLNVGDDWSVPFIGGEGSIDKNLIDKVFRLMAPGK